MLITYKVNFHGFWPVGANAIVMARDRGHARRMLLKELDERGLAEKNKDIELDAFVECDFGNYGVVILADGNY